MRSWPDGLAAASLAMTDWGGAADCAASAAGLQTGMGAGTTSDGGAAAEEPIELLPKKPANGMPGPVSFRSAAFEAL